MKYLSIVILIALLITPCSLFARPVAIDMSEPTPVNAGIRSLILPGWGQYFNGETKKMYIIGGSALVAASVAYLLYGQAQNTYDDYEKKGVKDDSLYSDYEAQADQATIASYIAAGVWLYGIIDAFISAQRQSEPDQQTGYHRPDGFSVAAYGDDVSFFYRMTF